MNDAAPLYRQVEAWLRDWIEKHQLAEGDALPSIAQVVKATGVHGLTVRRAIRELAQQQVVITRQGRGMFVGHNATRRILWVSGSPLFGASVSQYQQMMIGAAEAHARRQGMRLEPVLIREHDAQAASRWTGQPDMLRPFAGMVFCNCGLEHAVEAHAHALRLPSVTIAQRGQHGLGQVSLDLAQADALAMDVFEEKGISRLAVVGIDNQPLVSAGAVRERGMSAAITRAAPYPSPGSSVEQAGYELGCSLLAHHAQLQGWYLTDDVLARGATRAILSLQPDARKRPVVVVRTSRQQMMPLGLPVDYVVFDLQAQAEAVIDILTSQMNRTQGPTSYAAAYERIACDGQRVGRPVTMEHIIE